MLRSIQILALLLLGTTIFLSCSNCYQITIEQRNLPKINIPDEIQSITLMNRSLTSDFLNLNGDSLTQIFARKNFNLNAVILDSLASDTCLQATGELLFESGRYDIVVPVDRNIARTSKYYLVEQPLDWNFVKNTCATYNTDALLVLEKFVTKVNSDSRKRHYLESDSKKTEPYYFFNSVDIIYDSFFRLYNPSKMEITGEFLVTDTISSPFEAYSPARLKQKMYDTKKGLIDAGIYAALDLNQNISPLWTSDKREIFIFNKKNKDEQDYISNNNWQKLTEYWLPLTQDINISTKSKAEFNMALAAEFEGNIDEAITWASKSFNTKIALRTVNYIKKLKSRKAELEKIDQKKNQLFNF